MITSALILFYFLTPLLILFLCHRNKNLNKIGAFIITGLLGLILGNIITIPNGSDAFRNLLVDRSYIPETDALELFQQGVIRHNDLRLNQIASIQDLIISFVIPLSIPLMLFSFNLKSIKQILKPAFSSIIIAFFSIVVSVIAGFFLFRNSIDETWKISGMLAGMNIGGIPDLIATSKALGGSPNMFFLVQTINLIIGSIFFLFFKALNPYLINVSVTNSFYNQSKKDIIDSSITDKTQTKCPEILNKKRILSIAGALGMSVLIVAISFETCKVLDLKYQKTTMILLISALGLLLGQISKISQIGKNYDTGMYFILVFSLIITSMVDIRSLFQLNVVFLLLYTLFTVIVSILLIAILSTIFRINKNSTVISIIALFMSPAYIPLVAGELKKNKIFAQGISISIFGMAAGNFTAILLAYLLKYI